METTNRAKFCSNCGVEIDQNAEICPKCGVRVPSPVASTPGNVCMGGKSRITAGILALFLGGVGLHKFYLGKTGMGLLYLAFCWTFIPALIGLIEALQLFSMSDNEFNYKYNKW